MSEAQWERLQFRGGYLLYILLSDATPDGRLDNLFWLDRYLISVQARLNHPGAFRKKQARAKKRKHGKAALSSGCPCSEADIVRSGCCRYFLRRAGCAASGRNASLWTRGTGMEVVTGPGRQRESCSSIFIEAAFQACGWRDPIHIEIDFIHKQSLEGRHELT